MYLNEHYWFFEKALSSHVCDKIVKLAKDRKKEKALIGGLKIDETAKNKLTKDQKKYLDKVRKSNVTWVNDQWLYNVICPYIQTANKNAGWNFQIDWFETMQYTHYKKGQFYDWHCDQRDTPYNYPEAPHFHNKIRKISATVQLTEPEKYKGGELVFDARNKMSGAKNILKNKKFLPKGTVIVFPSFVWHKVTPVTKGERNSLVIWSLGKPYI
jgi:PKHD-type hydroxylase